MSTARDTRNAAKQQKQQEEAKGKNRPPSSRSQVSGKTDEQNMENILRELKELRKENKQAFADTREQLTRPEVSVTDLIQRMEKLERRTEEAETRICQVEDTGQRHERMLRHLLKREAALTNMCDDLQNWMRRNNLRIYQVPEESEKGDMIGFVRNLIETALQLPPELNIKIERAHRSLGLKPASSAHPRSIIVRFLDYTVKEAVLRQAWAQKQVKFQKGVIYFDQDYSPEIQRKRTRVRSSS